MSERDVETLAAEVDALGERIAALESALKMIFGPNVLGGASPVAPAPAPAPPRLKPVARLGQARASGFFA
jgi:hypothetical protein